MPRAAARDVFLGATSTIQAVAVEVERSFQLLPPRTPTLATVLGTPAGQREEVAGAQHLALLDQPAHGALERGAIPAVQPGGGEELGHAQRAAGALERPEQGGTVESRSHEDGQPEATPGR